MSILGKDTYNYITNEIDYDKLADAIVKANEEVECERQKQSKILTSSMALLLSVLFTLLSAVVGFFTYAISYLYIRLFTTINQSNLGGVKIASLNILICIIILAMLVVTIIMIVSAVKIYREKDKNFIMSAFSGVVGFAALVVAIIAMLKEVI